MRPALPSLVSLRAFEAVARLGRVQAAADELGRVPSAISHQLTALEAELGVALFRKDGRRRVLTEDGRAYAETLQRSFAQIAQAGDLLARRQTPTVLRLRSGVLFMTAVLGPKLAEFRQLHPEISLEIDVDERWVSSMDPGFDAAIVLSTQAPADLVSELVWRNLWAPVVTAEFFERIGGQVPVERLAEFPLVHSRHFPDLWSLWFAKYLPNRTLPTPSVFAEGGSSTLNLLQSGLEGVAVGVFPVITPLVQSGRLKVLVDAPMVGLDYRLVYHRDLVGSRKIQLLRSWLKAVAGEFQRMARLEHDAVRWKHPTVESCSRFKSLSAS